MASSITVSPDCSTAYKQLKDDEKYTYIIYRIVGKEIVTDETSEDGQWEDLQENLHKKGPAFAVYDFGESDGHKIAFISWTPGDATARTKMIYGSVRDTVGQSLDNFSLHINAYDAGDIDKGGVLWLLD
ncbi:Cofilin [Fusarium oxysporum f. sp. cubense race 1]|uniref:Cofilin n=1 Tax=Fusarium oxysporum f. sp. cubense (strain race 1) TaxID=1229664 RepID=N4UU37_FUSC1|nr:Cofilin [Fusarium oxysporum f. sp. cubense race 1]